MPTSAPSPSEPGTRRIYAHDIIADLKAKGLLRHAGDAAPVEKTGHDITIEAGLRSQWQDITPAMASRWLENNFVNRPMSQDVINAYACDMAAGKWVPTHQGIAFNAADALIDGQHRLSAIVKSGKTIRMMVTFGLPSKIEGQEMTTMDAVDRGRTRSIADQLKIQHGLKDGSVIAAITATIGKLCNDERTRRLSVGQTLDIYRAFELPMRSVIANRSKERGMKSAGFMAAFAFAMAAKPELSHEYLSVINGTAAERTAMWHLRNFLMSDESIILMTGTARGVAELTLEALRLQALGEPLERLEFSGEGLLYFRGLQFDRVQLVAALFRLHV